MLIIDLDLVVDCRWLGRRTNGAQGVQVMISVVKAAAYPLRRMKQIRVSLECVYGIFTGRGYDGDTLKNSTYGLWSDVSKTNTQLKCVKSPCY